MKRGLSLILLLSTVGPLYAEDPPAELVENVEFFLSLKVLEDPETAEMVKAQVAVEEPVRDQDKPQAEGEE